MIDLSLALGLTAALCWGSADFVAKISSAKIGYLKTALYMQLVGTVFMLLITGQDLVRLIQFPWSTCLAVILGVVNAIGTLALYKSFEIGKVSIMSPIASSYPALSSILAFMFLNEHISQMRLLGVATIFFGLLLISSQSTRPEPSGAKGIAMGTRYAFVAFAFMGVLFFGVKLVVPNLGGLLPVLVLRLVTLPILGVFILLSSNRVRMVPLSALPLVAFIGVVDSLANAAYNLGVSIGSVTIVSFVSSLFSAVTLLLAMTILRERLSRHQAVGVVCIMTGIATIGYFP